MLVFYIIVFLSFFIGASFNHNGIYSGFLDKKQTDTIKGLFILLVFLSHSLGMIKSSGCVFTCSIDITGMRVRSELGQLIVVMFLFYSGYGVMESISKKGDAYIDRFPRYRLLQTLLNFDVAVACFFFLNLALGIPMSFKQVGLSMIGWESIGNSNWYIFVILYCYVTTWIASKSFPKDRAKTALVTSLLVIGGGMILAKMKHGQSWWYNTLLCYPLGVLYSVYKGFIIPFSKKYYLPILGVLLSLFLFLHLQQFIPSMRGFSYNAKAIAFALLIVQLSMKVKLRNGFYQWAGAALFPIYIYQRIPMIAVKEIAGNSFICSQPYLFILFCAAITGGIALLYENWRIKLM